MFLVRIPWWIKKWYPAYEWQGAQTVPESVYLTFDDGPHPTITPWTLQCLQQYHAKATFFCIGKNVVENPKVYEQILAEGHAVGNHTHNHLKGWSTDSVAYIDNVLLAAKFIDSKLFRPPYGRVKRLQAKRLAEMGYRIIMWSVLSGDFDISLSPEKCLENVLFNIKPGDIITFHNSDKSWERMKYALPRVLEYCQKHKLECRTL